MVAEWVGGEGDGVGVVKDEKMCHSFGILRSKRTRA